MIAAFFQVLIPTEVSLTAYLDVISGDEPSDAGYALAHANTLHSAAIPLAGLYLVRCATAADADPFYSGFVRLIDAATCEPVDRLADVDGIGPVLAAIDAASSKPKLVAF